VVAFSIRFLGTNAHYKMAIALSFRRHFIIKRLANIQQTFNDKEFVKNRLSLGSNKKWRET